MFDKPNMFTVYMCTMLSDMRRIAEKTMISFSHTQMLYASAYRGHFRLAIEEDRRQTKLVKLVTSITLWNKIDLQSPILSHALSPNDCFLGLM